MTTPEGLFYASLDADSEGSEGSFYIWTNEEIRKYLGDEARLFLNYFSCEENGNRENNWNVLRKSMRDEDFAKQYNLSVKKLTSDLEAMKVKLFTVRGNRIRPATDDKILTSWNALMIAALADASRAFDRPDWLGKAIVAAEFYRVHLIRRNGKLWRNAKSGSFATAGFLDDYCFLIKAFLDIYQSTLDEIWLISAEELTSETILHFTADDGVFFRFTSDEEPELIQETIELSDNVIPASNSQMARNLFVLGCLQGRENYALRAEKMVKQMVSQVVKHPSFHANWASLLADIIGGPTTMSILGEESLAFLRELTKHYLPNVIFSGKLVTLDREVIENHSEKDVTLIYICHQKTCFSPVKTVGEALEILGRH